MNLCNPRGHKSKIKDMEDLHEQVIWEQKSYEYMFKLSEQVVFVESTHADDDQTYFTLPSDKDKLFVLSYDSGYVILFFFILR